MKQCEEEVERRVQCTEPGPFNIMDKSVCAKHLQAIVTYQLEKVDQGGAIMDHFEDKIHSLQELWGYPLNDAFELILPDGRVAGLKFEAYVEEPTPEEEWRTIPDPDMEEEE